MATKQAERADDGKFHCGCGESFVHAAWYTKHALKCDGKPVQTRGRIERLAARAGRALVPAPVQPRRRPAGPPPPAARPPEPPPTIDGIAAAATAQAMELTINGLLAQRAKIDVAIEALLALRA